MDDIMHHQHHTTSHPLLSFPSLLPPSSWDLLIEYLGLKNFMNCEWPPLRFDILSKDVIAVLDGLTIQVKER